MLNIASHYVFLIFWSNLKVCRLFYLDRRAIPLAHAGTHAKSFICAQFIGHEKEIKNKKFVVFSQISISVPHAEFLKAHVVKKFLIYSKFIKDKYL